MRAKNSSFVDSSLFSDISWFLARQIRLFLVGKGTSRSETWQVELTFGTECGAKCRAGDRYERRSQSALGSSFPKFSNNGGEKRNLSNDRIVNMFV